MKRHLLLFMGVLLFSITCHGQQRLTGKILSAETQRPLPGTSVYLKGSKVSASSDAAGKFILALSLPSDTLIISHIGYQTRYIPVSKETEPLVIQLQDTAARLQEVVVSTGYQKIPKARATGSFEKIDNQLLNRRISPDIITRLKGVSSILFDERGNQIRGLSTINGPKSPLIVVDNFPYSGDISNINPEDVESITILKDAAAASIWGTRAGNGVIVITTKKGELNKPLKISFTANLTNTKKPNLSNFHPMASSDFINVEKFLFSKGYYNSQINNRYKPLLSPVVELLVKEANGKISKTDAESKINDLKNIDVRNDYNRYIYQDGISRQYHLSFSGGSHNNSYNISGGYNKDINVLAAEYSRINLRAANTLKPLKNLSVSTRVLYTQTKSKTGKLPYNSIYLGSKKLYPYANLADNLGKPLPLYMYRQSFIDTVGEGKLMDWKYYPLDDWKHNYTTVNSRDILVNLGLKYQLSSRFNIDLKYQYERQQLDRNKLQDVNSYYTRNLINMFSQIDYNSGEIQYLVPKGGILDKTMQSLQSQSARVQLSYHNDWAKNSISGIVGGEIRSLKGRDNSNRIYGYDKNTLTDASVDYVNFHPIILGGYSFIPYRTGLSGTLDHYVSAYANAAYTYDSRYTISASMRRDASNLFGVTTNDKWTPLWSVGGSWDLSHEKFYKIKLLPSLKLRVTYGFSGNVDQKKSAVTTIKLGYSGRYTNLPAAVIYQYENPSLRWEKVGMFNVAFDFSFYKNIITGSIAYYKKNGMDLLGPAPVDYTTLPVSTITKNVANMKGSGIDANLHIQILNKSFKWSSNIIFSQKKTEITKYFLSNVDASNFVSSGKLINPIQGKPVYSILSYKWMGLDPETGDPQGILNGKLSKDYTSLYYDSVQNLVYSGPATPAIYGYFNNTFSWKGLSITPCISYRLGYYFRKQSISYSDLFSSWRSNSDFSKRWQQPGDEKNTNVPSMVYPTSSLRDGFYNNSEVLVRKAGNIRLDYIRIAYDIKPEIGQSVFRKLQFYAIASNLGILWRANNEGLDPDYDNEVPPSKSITFGVRASF